MTKENEKNISRNQEIVPVNQQAPTQVASFGTIEPKELVKKATQVANELSPIVEKKKLFTMISGKKYVQAEGWTTMGAMLGAFPEVEWTRKLPNGWEARVNIRTLLGQVISSAEAMCTRDERNWKTRDEYAIRSMAQTRATGKAFRLPFAWIMTLAGYEATPAEEMGETPTKTAYSPQLSPAQSAKIYAMLHNFRKTKEELEQALKKPIKELTKEQASKLIEKLESKQQKKSQEEETKSPGSSDEITDDEWGEIDNQLNENQE